MIKTALITGASSGLGVEFAKLHAQNKDNLVLVARSEDKMLQLKNELEGRYGIKVEVIVKDLSISSAAEDVFQEIVRKGIEVDYLINNAGFGGVGMFATRNFADDLSMINVNIVALTALTKLFLPLFIARNSGRILNVSSVAGITSSLFCYKSLCNLFFLCPLSRNKRHQCNRNHFASRSYQHGFCDYCTDDSSKII